MKKILFLSVLLCSNSIFGDENVSIDKKDIMRTNFLERDDSPEAFRRKTGLLQNEELMNVVREEVRNAQEILSMPNVRSACWQKVSDPRMKELYKYLPIYVGYYPGKSEREIINLIFAHLESIFRDAKDFSKIIAQKDAILSALDVASRFYNVGFLAPTKAMINAVAEKYDLKDYSELLQKKRDAESIVRYFQEGYLDVDSDYLKTPKVSEEIRKLEVDLAAIKNEYKTRMMEVNIAATQGKLGMFNPMGYLKRIRVIEEKIAALKKIEDQKN